MTTGARQIGDAGQAWEAVRADPAIQFAPVTQPATPPPEPPGWLQSLFRWLTELLEPVGRALGMNWPTFRWVLLAIAIVAALALAWRIVGPAIGWRPRAAPVPESEWAPETGDALALLEDADRLAAEGRFDEATHLLLRRSIGQIAAARPGLVEPATTARELSGMAALPDGARSAFATIAERVERSLFALRALGPDDWQAARDAYARFALARLASPAA
ncbi:hypothetical protein GRI40_07050 [Altererythrobacter aerius]|uniref:DUF4129 domain-containing protein n=1 Tax=Tsuneonella aeria TaxID=1837929 RepID=A0A6I4TE95_9SPHN|nr:hypothetical protein [Tsuneonella aeria]MXO74977.1 hypothetical protein [Tsuneonella aeria]